MKIINKNATELLYFMDKFLEFAQAESSLFSTEYQTFDLINAIQLVLKNNENAINEKNLTINIDFEDLCKKTIYSDETAVKRILQNVLETSIKLTDVGSITIKADNPEMELVEKCGVKIVSPAQSQSYIRIAVTDTGMGLAESEIEGIFEPYTQLDKSNKKTIVRSITLGIAYTIVKRMGGAIWVDSEVMKGSTFYIILPVEKDANA